MHDSLCRSFALLALAAAASTAAACSGTESPASARAASTTSTSRSAATSAPVDPDVPLDLCKVMPVGVVSGILQARIGKGVSIATTHAGGMCAYRDVDKGVPGVQVLIDFTTHTTSADATTAYRNAKAQAASMGLAVDDVPGLGDEAFGSSDQPYTYGVKTRHDRHMGQVNVRTEDIASDALRPAATELARQTLARLP